MIFRQVTHDDLGCASYLVGDEEAGVAAVVEPKLEIEEYLALARYAGARCTAATSTSSRSPRARSRCEEKRPTSTSRACTRRPTGYRCSVREQAETAP